MITSPRRASFVVSERVLVVRVYDENLLQHWLARWKLYRARATPIAQLVPGQVAKIVGVAGTPGGAPPITTPFLARECVTMRVVGTRQVSRSEVELIDDFEDGQFFEVRDETGVARVDRKGWSRLLVSTAHVHGVLALQERRNLERWTEARGAGADTFFQGWSLGNAYYERSIELGARVAVLGMVVETNEFAASGTSETYRDRPRIRALVPPPDERLLIGSAS